MKKSSLLFFLFCFAPSISAAPGCMSQTQKLQRYDTKDYHYVHCNCPCAKLYKVLADRGKCTRCFHFRDPQTEIIISTRDTDITEIATETPKKLGNPVQEILKKAVEEQALSF